MSARFDSVESGSGESLLTRFQVAVAGEDVGKFVQHLQRVEDVIASGKILDHASFLALLDSCYHVLVFNEAIIKKWVKEDPQIGKTFEGFEKWASTLGGSEEDI
jgi:hypothetical protein